MIEVRQTPEFEAWIEGLRDAGCDTGPLQIAVGYVPRPGADWNASEFHVDFTRGAT